MISDKRSSGGFRNCTGKERIKVFALLASLALLFIGNSTYGQFKYNPNTLVPFDPSFKMGRLDNGIRYIVRSNPIDKGKAYFYAFFKVGSIQESPKEYGTAHFIEHLYADYPEYDNQVQRYLQSVGLKIITDMSANTSEEKTQYTIFNVPVQREETLDSVLMILKKVPFYSISSATVEKQRKIVLAEWKERFSETDLPEVENKVQLAGMHRVIGDTVVINHITADRLKQFHDKWYRPDNLTIIAIGDFNAPKMEARIKQIFGSLPQAEGVIPNTNLQLPDNKEPVIGITQTDEEENSVEINYKHDALPYNQKRLREDLMDQLISEMFSQRIREAAGRQAFSLTLNWASYVNSYLNLSKYNSYSISFTSDNINKALNWILAQKEQIEKYGFTLQELGQVKKGMLQRYQIRQQKNNQLPYSEYYIKCFDYLLNRKISPSFDFLCRFVQTVTPGITLNEINNRFRGYTSGIHPIVNIDVSQKSMQPTIDEIKTILTSTRTVRPYVPSAPVTSLEDNTIQPGHVEKESFNKKLGTTEWTLSNGLKVVIKTTDFNDNEIQFEGLRNRALLSLNEEYFPSLLFGDMLLEKMGLDHYTSGQVDQLLTGKYLSVETLLLPQVHYLEGEKQGIFGYTIPRDIGTCLQLINLHFNHQRWDDEFLNKKIDQIKKGLKIATPETAMNDTLNYYSETVHRKQSVFSDMEYLSPERLKKLFCTVFDDPADFTFFFSGNIKAEEVKPLIEKYLGSIKPNKGGGADNEFLDQKIPSANETWKTGRVSHQFRYPMQTPVAKITINCLGKTAVDSRGMLCRDMSSLLLKDDLFNFIREKNNVTYDVGNLSLVSAGKEDPVFHALIQFQTDPKIAEPTRQKSVAEFERFMQQGPEEKDFSAIKDKMIQKRTNDLKSNQWWVDTAMYGYYREGKIIADNYLNEIKNITLNDIATFTRQMINQGNVIDIMILPK